MALDPATNALLHLQDVVLALHERHQVLQAFAHTGHLEHVLLLVQFERHVRRHGIGQPRRLVDAGKRSQHLWRHLLVQLDILVEQVGGRTHQHFHFALGQIQFVIGGGDLRPEILAVFHEAFQPGTLIPFHQHLDRAVGKLQQLQNIGERADLVQILRLGIVDIGAALRHQQYLFVVGHCRIQCLDRLVSPDKQGDHHIGIDNHVAQRQYRHCE